ncbi:WGxxGxxG family protein [Paenibacillus sp. UNC496MF]|uniref:WGxxGxxG family protein n=1 Tax=Paenibacillus sp. UNC496MF TaxID=1502753 RepID=UPI000B8115F1|nr:WGxxGxxG family protein [Paenibacillus sp. UNC496MF]
MKYLLTVSYSSCFALMLGAGILNAAGSATSGGPATNSLSNQSYDNRSTNSYNAASATGGNYRTNAVNDDNDFDWGWLGLLGLIGLAGMRSRNHD